MDGPLSGVFLISQVSRLCNCSIFKIDSLFSLGGGPVEIGSGMGGLAYSWVLGRRQKRELVNFRPHNVSLVGLGSASSELFYVRYTADCT